MTHFRRVCIVAATLIVALSLGAGVLAQGRIVRMALETEPNHFDPRINVVHGRGYLAYSLFDNLVQTDREGNIVPGLARSWEMLNPSRYRFTLHEGIVTHFGNVVDAAAIADWIEDMFDPDRTSYQSRFTGTALTAEVVDTLVVDLLLAQPYGAFLTSMSIPHTAYFDLAHYREVGPEAFARHPSGTGPFKFAEWVALDRVVVTANPDYFRGPPQVDEIHYLVIPDMDTKVLALETGSVDLVVAIPTHELPGLEANPDIRLEAIPEPRTADIQPNSKHPILSDIRVRKGLAHALNRDEMVEVLAPTAAPLEGQYHEAVFGFKPGLVYEYDPELAAQLLNEAGWERNADGWFEEDGQVLELGLQVARGRYINDFEMAELVEAQMRDFGVRINIELFESAAWFDYMISQANKDVPDYGLAGWFWGIRTLVPVLALEGMYATGGIGNTQQYSNPHFDELIVAAKSAPDPESMREIIWELQDIVYENVLNWPLFTLVNVVAVNERLLNTELTFGGFIRMDELALR